MMKFSIVSIISACLLMQGISTNQLTKDGKQYFVQEWLQPSTTTSVSLDLCKGCLDFMDQAIQAVLNLILQAGIGDTCPALCQALADKTGSKDIGEICEVLCVLVGFDEFVHILQKADIDPIFYCEELKGCPINDNGDAKFTSFNVKPKSGPQGVFDISFEYTSQNGTGTGEIALDVKTVDDLPVGSSFLHEIADAGVYNGQFKLKAEPDPDCDPTQDFCEMWLPGNYTVKIAICNGECGSKHPHSQIYDEATADFEITK